MRPTTRTAAVALLGAAAIGLTVPAAADDSPVGSVGPSTAQPGDTVHLSLHNCHAWMAKADGGEAFGLVKLQQEDDRTFTGKATVSHDAKPGTQYTVKFQCGNAKDKERAAILSITKTSGGSHGGPHGGPYSGQSHHPSQSPEHRPSHGTQGAQGGSIGRVSTTTAVAGAAVIAAAAVGGVFLVRRRARNDS